MAQTKIKTFQKLKRDKVVGFKQVLEKTRAIRTKVTAASGTWNAVKVLRDIRYA